MAGFSVGGFLVNIGANYLLSRLSARDGPRLDNLDAGGGQYGLAKPRLFGPTVRVTGLRIAMDDIKETRHKVKDYAALVGAATGAIQGFMLGGPIGAGIGAVVGGLLGAATPKQYYYTYSDTFAVLIADRNRDDPIEGVLKIWAQGRLIFDASESEVKAEQLDAEGRLIFRKYGKNKYFKSLTIYGGGFDQVSDPILNEAIRQQPGYRGSALAVFEDLQLAKFGQSVPAVEPLVAANSDETVASFAERCADEAGIDRLRSISTTATAATPLRGYALTQEGSCWDALKPLMPVFGFDAAEVAGQVRLYSRAQTMRATIPLSRMGAAAFGDDGGAPIRFSRQGETELPRETSLTFIDPARDYQNNTATSVRSEGSAKSNVAVNLAITLSATEGAKAAATLHWDAHLGRISASFALTDAWIGLAPGLAYGLPMAGEVVPFAIRRRLRGANGVIEVEARSDEAVTYSASVAASSGNVSEPESTLLPATRVVAIDMPITSDDHDDYGFYVAIGGGDRTWTRGRVELSSDGVTFGLLIDSQEEAVMGDVSGVLAAGPTDGLDDTLDSDTVLTVVLLHDGMELSSATDGELDAWANFAFVGSNGMGEYLQFKTATKVAARTWELTDLRRGRRGTDWAIAGHLADEEFVLLGEGGFGRVVYTDETAWGDDLFIRGVTLHQDEADVTDVIAFTNTGEGKRPFSPVEVEGVWDGSNNATLDCTARSRLFAGGLGIDDLNDTEWVITNATPDRTIIVTGGTAANYSAAQQAADGLTVGGTIIGRVRRLSDVNDGRWRDFTLYGPATRTADSTVWTADTTLITADMG